ncbi:MAG: O-antigen ligase family protein [Lachnospiraceae bacterium]|nr:O-antigen ligase family protein [Lachnospiraceae bacterium]
MFSRNRNNIEQFSDMCRLIPPAAVLAVVPLIYRLYYYDTGLEKYDFFPTDGTAFDLALHGKMVVFVILSAVMAVLIAVRLITEKKARSVPEVFIPLFAYGVLALLSSLFSRYQPYPRTGIYEQFEPCTVLLGYVVTAYYVFLMLRNEQDVRLLIYALAAGTLLLVIVGFSQAFFTDILDTEFGKRLVIPSRLYDRFIESGGEFRHKFRIWRVAMTFSNPNYVGSFVPLVSPVILIMVFAEKKKPVKLFFGVLYICLMICLFGSGSKTGFIGTAASLAVLWFMFGLKSRKGKIVSLASLGVTVLFLVIYALFGGNDYLNRLFSSFDTGRTNYTVTGIETTDRDVVITVRGKRLHVEFDPDEMSVTCLDDTGTELDIELNDENMVIIDDPAFKDVSIAPVRLTEDVTGFEVFAERAWYFAHLNSGYYYYTPYGKFIRHTVSEKIDFLDEHGLFATGRGFLWSRTIPLLKKYILLGSGADTFSIVYPGSDFVASYNSTNWGFIVTKPHCMYLQIAVQTGVLSLIAVLVYFAMLLGAGFKNMRFKPSDNPKVSAYTDYIEGAILAGMIGYILAAVFNDSSVAIAPVFWTLTGIAAAINLKLKMQTYV